MPKLKLTAAAVERVRTPPSGRVEYFDAALPAFAMRVTDKGSKSWVLFYRFGGRLRRMTLGKYPSLTLADARDAARRALREVEKGLDPAHVKAERERRQLDTVGVVSAEFIERYAKPKTRGWRETQRIFEREILPRWGKRPIETISRRDVIALLDEIMDRGAPYMANQTLAAVRRMFNWAIERDILESSPIAGVKAPGAVTHRDRILDDAEISALWPVFDQLGYPFGPVFKLLLVTAQRRDEVAHLRWQDMDPDAAIWTIPREMTKSDREHEVPLSGLALEILAKVPRLSGNYMFSGTDGSRSVSGFSRAKARVDERSGVTGWRVHDLRRTAASGIARLGTPVNVLSKVLNHASAGQGGVTAIYNRYAYGTEKRQALEAWSQHLRRTISSNVTSSAA